MTHIKSSRKGPFLIATSILVCDLFLYKVIACDGQHYKPLHAVTGPIRDRKTPTSRPITRTSIPADCSCFLRLAWLCHPLHTILVVAQPHKLHTGQLFSFQYPHHRIALPFTITKHRRQNRRIFADCESNGGRRTVAIIHFSATITISYSPFVVVRTRVSNGQQQSHLFWRSAGWSDARMVRLCSHRVRICDSGIRRAPKPPWGPEKTVRSVADRSGRTRRTPTSDANSATTDAHDNRDGNGECRKSGRRSG